MQVLVILGFLFTWLIVLWFGSIALEITGLERTKARFQALSGFTTGEAEAVVNDQTPLKEVASLGVQR